MKAEMKKQIPRLRCTLLGMMVFVGILSISLAGSASAGLAKRIDALIRQSSQRKVRFSIHIIKADSGKTVYGHNANRAMVPASNMKIITTAAALRYLGPNYKYKTRIGLCGDTLVVTGSGDPLLGDKATDAKYNRQAGWIFKDITAALKQNGIKAVRDIIVDSSIFDDERVHPNWPRKELNRWYACEVSGLNFSGLNFNGNCIDITTKTIGGKVALFIEPQTDYVRITNKVKPIRKGKSAVGSYRQPGKSNNIIVKGRCRKRQGPFAVAIERPAAFFGYLLAENLAEAGINTEGQLLEKAVGRDCNFKELIKHTTPITHCLARCNKDSFQLAAESLLKTIAAEFSLGGKNGTWEQGRELIRRYLLELGIEKEQFYIDDGSGLSRQNKLSANAVTRVLFDVYRGGNWRFYRNSLAVGGVDGTIGKYFKEKNYRGKIFGKTGYIDGVKSFSGVCGTASGDYIFSILANNTNGRTRKAINDIAKAIIGSQ
jgi:D-alanyl-D-alanine carboxypeptidase/D-alanyl-D-alanine-endopeptidase (penicillin-binding protein 4)